MTSDCKFLANRSHQEEASSQMLYTESRKKSRLHGTEPEEDFTFYVVFEEGTCINNPVSAKLSINVTSTVKGIALGTVQFFEICTMQS